MRRLASALPTTSLGLVGCLGMTTAGPDAATYALHRIDDVPLPARVYPSLESPLIVAMDYFCVVGLVAANSPFLATGDSRFEQVPAADTRLPRVYGLVTRRPRR